MPGRDIAGQTVQVDAEGFLCDPNEWSRDIAQVIAREEGIDPLTDLHWKVIEFCRADFKAKGESPTLRRITKEGGVDTKTLYALFPKGPAKKVARISGLGKPTGCI